MELLPEKRKISKKRLEELTRIIGERDLEILKDLEKCKYLTSNQIRRLHFNNSTTETASLRAASRSLSKLRNYGALGALRRRIGGIRAGSGSYIWSLRPAGYKLLHLKTLENLPRKHFQEPSLQFLEHTLLISETYVRVKELHQTKKLDYAHAQVEPTCWRWYVDRAGIKHVLKPDLYAVTRGGGYEDTYFVEIDRATETPARILDKCDRYYHYLHTGTEQEGGGVFPYVLWIVPDERRKKSLENHIQEKYEGEPELFTIITPDELEALILDGVDEYKAKSQKKSSMEGGIEHEE